MNTEKGFALVFCFVACFAVQPTAFAQDEGSPAEASEAADGATVAEEAPDDDSEVINVTGSRIKRRSIATAAPVAVINSQDILATGRTTVAEILQRLPASANGINTQFNNGGNGASRVNLRSLGPTRTLVLVDGRRYVAGGDGANASVDLNSIPLSMVDRIEILKDGASAVYGSDAVAGVVNIILKRDVEGVEASAYSSITERGDGRIYQVDVTGGVSTDDGRGNLIFSALFLDQQPIFAGERDWSADALGFDFDGFDAAGRPDDFTPFITRGTRSSAVPGGRIIDRSGAAGNAAWDALGCNGGTCQNFADTGWRTGVTAEDGYNFQPENYLATPFQRLSFYTKGNYEVNDYLGFFFEGSFTNRQSEQLIAPNPLFTISNGPNVVSATNRFNPFGRDFIDVRRRMLEAGNRVFIQDSNTFRLVIGMQGEIPEMGPISGWGWDAYVNYGRTETTNIQEGLFDNANLNLALGPDADCTGDCVPLNLFGGPGSITQEMIDYISFTGIERGFSEQHVAAVNVGGPLFNLFAADPVALAIGYQFRREDGANTPNPLAVSGDQIGATLAQPVSGFYEVNSGYAELSVPIVSGVPGLELLELNAAARLEDFNTFGSNTTYKVGLRYNPVNFLAVRGTFSTAFRAPNINELFSGQNQGFPNVSDPCSLVPGVGSLDDPIVAANCAADGLGGGVLDPSTQIATLTGGNINLNPETADTFTVGIVLEDSLLKGLTAAVDYYQISISDAIQNVGAGTILSGCYNQESRQFCDQIVRDPGSGVIINLEDQLTNVGGFDASGLDFDVRYASPNLPFGRLGAGVEGTILFELSQTDASGFTRDFVGNYDQRDISAGAVNPDYRLNAYLRWAWQFLNAGANFRYLPSFEECENNACSVNSDAEPISRPVDDYFYMDLYAGTNFSTFLGNTNITVGINNLTDVEPSFIGNGFTASTEPAAYDFAGRSFYARLTQRF